jgi:hypothetical protein
MMSAPAMKQASLQDMTLDQLVERFAALALEQDRALLRQNITRVNQLYDALKDVEGELKLRDGDQRRALLRLYDHKNPQVRLKAVKATLAVIPETARPVLQAIADSREYPQAGEAGMSIWSLKEGIYKPK